MQMDFIYCLMLFMNQKFGKYNKTVIFFGKATSVSLKILFRAYNFIIKIKSITRTLITLKKPRTTPDDFCNN